MRDDEHFHRSLQETILAALAFDDKFGPLIAGRVKATDFDGDYEVIARACLDHWTKYHKAPRGQLDDVLAPYIQPAEVKSYGDVCVSLLFYYDQGVDLRVTVDQIDAFKEQQQISELIYESAQRASAKGHRANDEIRQVWSKFLLASKPEQETSMALTDIDRLLSHLQLDPEDREFISGIEALDKRFIGPSRGAALLMLGATGAGKSWGLIHIAKHALRRRGHKHRVLHVTLEMPEEQVIQRYVQSLFSVPRRKAGKIQITTIERDTMGSLVSLSSEPIQPAFTLDSQFVEMELQSRLVAFDHLTDNLLVKGFPSGSLTVQQLDAYLDELRMIKQFEPDMVVVDYIGLMKVDTDELRHSLGRNMVGLRAIGQRRNCAIVTAQQISREGARARRPDLTHVAEDWSLTNTADVVLVYSATDAEHQFGLGQLFVAKARGEADKFRILLTQNYGIGQFALDSIPFSERDHDTVKRYMGDATDDDQ